MSRDPTERDDVDIFEINDAANNRSQWNQEQVEGILHEIDRQHQDAESSRGENVDILMERIEQLESTLEDYTKIKEENAKLKQKLEYYQRSPPISAYIIVIMGVSISIAGYFVSRDLVFAIGGIGIVLIGLAAIWEARVKRARKQ